MATKKLGLQTSAAPWESADSSQDAPISPEVGIKLGQYKLLERLSDESSSPVFRALNEEIGREEALKLISSDIDESTRNRYRHEINLLGRLDIPGIITVYRCGCDTDENGQSWTYFSMPLIRGHNLDEYIRKNNCSLTDRLRLLERSAEIIASLHNADILHKDLKPANVMVAESGDVRLLDLGIARLSEEKDVEGEYVGTPAFSSPEQLQAQELTQATDVYSFAVMCFFILSGRHPYLSDINAGYHTAKEACLIPDKTRFENYVPEFSGPLADLLHNCMATDPLERPSIHDIHQALAAASTPATSLKVSLVIGEDCEAEKATLDRSIRNFQVYYGKALEVETSYGYSDDADVSIILLWNKKVYLEDIFMDDGEKFRYALFKSGQDPLKPATVNLRETSLANRASDSGFTVIEFRELAELERLFFRFLRRVLKNIAPDIRRIPRRSWHEAPYVGLKTFEYRHAPVFFGRTFALSRCLDLLRLQRARGHNLLMIHGSSGCGKSSLVRAGLLPMLCENSLYRDIAIWDYVIIEFNTKDISWQEQVRQALAEKLGEKNHHKSHEISGQEIDTWLTETSYANGLKKDQGGLVFVFDQMESFFSQEYETEQRNRFDEFLMEVSSRPNALIITTMRSDFLPALNTLPCFKEETKVHGIFQLLPPNEYELNEIIRYPAIAAGLSFEDDPETGSGLEQSLCREAVNSPEGLPLLEFLLSELYSLAHSDGLITWDEYKKLGGIDGALSRKAEQALNEIPEESQITLPRIILKLMSLTPEKNLIRNWMPLEEAAETSNHRKLIDHFVSSRLFVIKHNKNLALISVSHEALIRSWPRITELAQTHHDFLKFRADLISLLKNWEKAPKDDRPERLLTGPLLKQGNHFFKRVPEFLTRREKEYLQQSLLEKTRQDQVRNQQRLRYAKTIIIISLLTLIITVTSTFVIYRQKSVTRENDEEIIKLEKAKEDLKKEIDQTRKYLAELEKERSKISRNNKMRRTDNILSQLAEDIQKGSYISIESFKELHDIEEDMRSWEWGYLNIQATPLHRPLLGHEAAVLSINSSPDRRYLVTASWDNKAIIWDRFGNKIQELTNHPNKKNDIWDIEFALFSPDGKYVVTSSMQGEITIWPFEPQETTPKFSWKFKNAQENSPVRHMAFSPDGKFLLSCNDKGIIKVWDWQNKNFNKSISQGVYSEKLRCTKIMFSPNGSFLTSCGWIAKPITWTLSPEGIITKQKEFEKGHHEKAIRDLCFIDNEHLVTVGQDKKLIIWDTKSGKPKWTDTPNNDDITAVDYDPSLNVLATASQNGRIVLKVPFKEKLYKEIKFFTNSVRYLSFSQGNGKLLAASRSQIGAILTIDKTKSTPQPHYKDYTVSGLKAFCSSGDSFLTYALDQAGDIYQLTNGQVQKLLSTRVEVGIHDVINFSFKPSENLFTVALSNGIIIECNKEINRVTSTGLSFFAAKTSPDGNNVALLDQSNKLHLYKKQSNQQEPLIPLLEEHNFTNFCWLTPDKILLADENRYIYEYSLLSTKLKELFQPFHGNQIYFMEATLGPEGPVCMTAARDNKVIFTNLINLNKSKEFDHRLRPLVFSASLSPDVKRIASICQNTKAPYLWNVLSEDELFSLTPMPGNMQQIHFVKDGLSLIARDDLDTVRVYLSSPITSLNSPSN